MTAGRESYRRILAATVIMGGATIASILIGVVRTKIFALLIGPAGIGLVGLFTSVSCALVMLVRSNLYGPLVVTSLGRSAWKSVLSFERGGAAGV